MTRRTPHPARSAPPALPASAIPAPLVPVVLFAFAVLLAFAGTVVLAGTVGGALAAAPAKTTGPPKKPKGPRTTTFEVCRRGCRYRTIQKAVDAAGAFAGKHHGAKVRVAIRPGRYVEGVVLDGARSGADFDGMTIEGTSAARKRTVLEGRGAAAQNGIEAVGVDGLVLRNLWARNFESSGFLVHASAAAGGRCDGYTMSNLLASGNHAFGLAARGCVGGEMADSTAYHQGDSGFSVGETPCDSPRWNVYDGQPCQARPRWTVLRSDESRENTLGYGGPNSKYVQVTESAFFDNGAGIVVDSLGDEALAPAGWNLIERNDVFWNNYNPFLARAAVPATAAGLGELGGEALNYPTGVGIVFYGGDHDLVRGNHVFGNYKWGIATLSRPAEAPFADEFDEARSVDNEIVENFLGRGGADPNGEYDIWNDATGGGNCWGANSPGSTFAPGNGKVPQGQIYPICPQPPVAYATAKSTNLTAGLQTSLNGPITPATSLGYLTTDPPQDQQCSWVHRVSSHLPFQEFVPTELTPNPGEVTCERG